jgi:hypothetical protein
MLRQRKLGEKDLRMKSVVIATMLALFAGAAAAQSATLRHVVEVPGGCEGDEANRYPVILDLRDRACTVVAEAQWRDTESIRLTLKDAQCGLPTGTAWIVPGAHDSGVRRAEFAEKLEVLRAAYPASEVARRESAAAVIECKRKQVVVSAAKGAVGKQAGVK